jgi:YhcH/YjgK/YiaL family protein
MIYGHLEAPDSYAHLLCHPAWRQAFEWLNALPNHPQDGSHRLRGEDLYVMVMTYDTLPRHECRFESHRRYLDLQVLFEGSELIDWCRTSELQADDCYEEKKDVQFYRHRNTSTCLKMGPGNFAIFYPSDSHRPKIADGLSRSVRKAVFKINTALLSYEKCS